MEITTLEQLREVVGEPHARAATKVRSELSDLHRDWIARSPFYVVATAGADGTMDVSPKGDPPGSVLVLDERTLALPDRPGNRRVDGFVNVLENPRVGLIFLIPGRRDTLRVNGRARLLLDPDDADRFEVRGHVPRIVTEVTVEEVFTHCSKAFMRSHLWEPEQWPEDDLPSVAEMARATSPETPMADLERHYAPENYEQGLYRQL